MHICCPDLHAEYMASVSLIDISSPGILRISLASVSTWLAVWPSNFGLPYNWMALGLKSAWADDNMAEDSKKGTDLSPDIPLLLQIQSRHSQHRKKEAKMPIMASTFSLSRVQALGIDMAKNVSFTRSCYECYPICGKYVWDDSANVYSTERKISTARYLRLFGRPT